MRTAGYEADVSARAVALAESWGLDLSRWDDVRDLVGPDTAAAKVAEAVYNLRPFRKSALDDGSLPVVMAAAAVDRLDLPLPDDAIRPGAAEYDTAAQTISMCTNGPTPPRPMTSPEPMPTAEPEPAADTTTPVSVPSPEPEPATGPDADLFEDAARALHLRNSRNVSALLADVAQRFEDWDADINRPWLVQLPERTAAPGRMVGRRWRPMALRSSPLSGSGRRS